MKPETREQMCFFRCLFDMLDTSNTSVVTYCLFLVLIFWGYRQQGLSSFLRPGCTNEGEIFLSFNFYVFLFSNFVTTLTHWFVTGRTSWGWVALVIIYMEIIYLTSINLLVSELSLWLCVPVRACVCLSLCMYVLYDILPRLDSFHICKHYIFYIIKTNLLLVLISFFPVWCRPWKTSTTFSKKWILIRHWTAKPRNSTGY